MMGGPSISQEIITMLENFYEHNDISRQAPGKSDTIVVRTDVRKETHQRRHLFMTVAVKHISCLERSTQINALECQSLLNYDLSMYFCLVIYQSLFLLADTIKILCCSVKQHTKFRVTLYSQLATIFSLQ